jgi:hypothetical protein
MFASTHALPEPVGKGLKLEETWNPPPETEDDDDADESSDDGDEPEKEEEQEETEAKVPARPLAETSFFL